MFYRRKKRRVKRSRREHWMELLVDIRLVLFIVRVIFTINTRVNFTRHYKMRVDITLYQPLLSKIFILIILTHVNKEVIILLVVLPLGSQNQDENCKVWVIQPIAYRLTRTHPLLNNNNGNGMYREKEHEKRNSVITETTKSERRETSLVQGLS